MPEPHGRRTEVQLTRAGRGQEKLVDIECRVVQRRPKAIAIVDGTTETVNGRERDKWFWLPLEAVEENDDGTVTMPERLALNKGLI